LIGAEHLKLNKCRCVKQAPAASNSNADDERSRILRALEESKWNRRQAAEALGMSYSALRYKLQRLGVSK
jgi:two-component system response regulator PilR (NtrC family)